MARQFRIPKWKPPPRRTQATNAASCSASGTALEKAAKDDIVESFVKSVQNLFSHLALSHNKNNMIRKRFTRRLAPQKEAVPLDQVRERGLF